MRVLQFFAESLQALRIPLPPPVITQQPQAARLLVRIAVAEGSSLIVQRNGPVQIARDAAARLIAFRKAAQCLHVALLRCARIKLRGTRPVLLHTVPRAHWACASSCSAASAYSSTARAMFRSSPMPCS